jgi:hypothetical protein
LSKAKPAAQVQQPHIVSFELLREMEREKGIDVLLQYFFIKNEENTILNDQGTGKRFWYQYKLYAN